MKEKRIHSLVTRIILKPLSLLVLIDLIMIISCANGFFEAQEKVVEGNIHSVKLAAMQLTNMRDQMDTMFHYYLTQEKSYQYLRLMEKDTPYEEYFRYEARTRKWMEQQKNILSDYVDALFMYYENLDLLLFRGNSDNSMHQYIRQNLLAEDQRYNCSQIVDADGELYWLCIYRYGDLYSGGWKKLEALAEKLELEEENFEGIPYLLDGENQTVYSKDQELESRGALLAGSDRVSLPVGKYENYKVPAGDLYIGILVKGAIANGGIPFFYKMLLGIALAATVAVPVIIWYMKKRIAEPIYEMKDAMERFGKGDIEYRLPLPSKKAVDELDLLREGLNRMMDSVADLQISLYKTKIREQEIKLRYVSQQIRPHFILNALNLIYTCKEDEIHVMKKMIRYLVNYFRYVVNIKVDFIELEKEMAHIKNYLNIQKERYGDTFMFFVEWEEEASECLIPPLILQTFVENCVKYAYNEKGLIFYVLASVKEHMLHIIIADNGEGFQPEMLRKLRNCQTGHPDERMGVGIQNAMERLDILYRQKGRVVFRNALGGGAVVELFLPITQEGEETYAAGDDCR